MACTSSKANTGQIAVSNRYFKIALRDYKDWRFAFWREFLQNAVDCGSGKAHAHLWYDKTSKELIIQFQNDGRPMNRSELFEKFLALGETSKSGTAIGGFGKAKEILCFAHNSYEIRTGIWLVVGSGSSFSFKDDLPMVCGTKTTVRIENQESYEVGWFIDKLRSVVAMSKLYQLTVTWAKDDGQAMVLNSQDRLGKAIRKTEKFRVSKYGFASSDLGQRAIVRAGGVAMFTRDIGGKQSYIFDLIDEPREDLTSNRDGLIELAAKEFDQLLKEVTTETVSFDRSEVELKTVIQDGLSFYGSIPDKPTELQSKAKPEVAEKEVSQESEVAEAEAAEAEVAEPSKVDEVKPFPPAPPPPAKYSIVLKGYGTRPLRRYWCDTHVSTKLKRLISKWVTAVRIMHEITSDRSVFRVGLVFDKRDDRNEAMLQEVGGYTTFFINPLTIEGTLLPMTSYDDLKLISFAAHEYVHKQTRYHDEIYASRLTDIMTLCMAHLPKFRKALRETRVYDFAFPSEWPQNNS